MAHSKTIVVKETLKELRAELKKAPSHFVLKIRMLIEIKQSELSYSKNELAGLIGVNHNSIQAWRTTYINEGLSGLLKDGRIGFKKPLLSTSSYKKIEKLLLSEQAHFTSYKQLHHWVDANLQKGINYNSLRHFVKRVFGAKLKVARKSHINKSVNDGILFKKTLRKNVKKP